jgi:glycosyltransferase involved in cell wall biosynthesis
MDEMEITRPSVSIGMPVFNGEQFIRQAIDSLRAQTYTDWELLISDNASTDGTGAICADFAAKEARIHYVRQPKNIGSFCNFNYVYRNTHAPLFMWAAADDVWAENWLAQLVELIRDDRTAFAFGQLQHIDEEGYLIEHFANRRMVEYDFSSSFLRRMHYFLDPEALGKANLIYGLFPREAVAKLINTLEMGYRYADCIAIWRLLSDYRVRATPSAFLSKRIHAGAVSAGKARPAVWTFQSYLDGLVFTVLARCSLLGLTDYFRGRADLTSVLYIVLIPVKAVMSVISLCRLGK